MPGVYVHFPFCAAKCPYCDFGVHVVREIPHEAYADAVVDELARRVAAPPEAGGFVAGEAESLYLGGGTPALWSPRALGRVLEAIARAFPLSPGAEVTVEANPGETDAAALSALVAAGVNRVSFGVQSFDAGTLAALGRTHTPDDARRAVDLARATGVASVSLDLIYGAPGQTPAAAAADARTAAECAPGHVSAYALTLEGGVPMERAVRRGRLRVPDADRVADIEDAVLEALAEGGYERYEISSHARPGHRARHNTLYWQGADYLGLGASASGFRRLHDAGAGRRYTNHRGVGRYLKALAEAPGPPEAMAETLDPPALLVDRLFTGLRTTDGVDLAALAVELGVDPRVRFARELDGLVADGLLARAGDRVRPTARGLKLNDTVALRFF